MRLQCQLFWFGKASVSQFALFFLEGTREKAAPSPLSFSRRFSFLCSLTAAHRFGRIFHFGIFGPIIRGRQDGPGFDVDYLDHGPPRGRAAALS